MSQRFEEQNKILHSDFTSKEGDLAGYWQMSNSSPSLFGSGLAKNVNADLVLSVVLQSLSIKEMQNSIDFTAAQVPRLRSVTILTPLPEQNGAKCTQRQSIKCLRSYRL